MLYGEKNIKIIKISIIVSIIIAFTSGCSPKEDDGNGEPHTGNITEESTEDLSFYDNTTETGTTIEDNTYTGLMSDENGTWYYENGIINKEKNGFIEYNGYTYYLDNGKSLDYEPSFFGTYNGRKTFIIGDSRARQAYSCVYGDDDWKTRQDVNFEQEGLEIWKASGGSGFDFMSDALMSVENEIDNVTDIIILSGFNDASSEQVGIYYLENRYTELINEISEKFHENGANIYYVSLNPAADRKERPDGVLYNDKIEDWNAYMINNLDRLYVQYIDTYNNVELKKRTYDGIHYEKEANIDLINYIMQNKIYY